MLANSVNTILCCLFISVGLILIIGDLAFGYKTLQFVKNASSAEGVVTKLYSGQYHPEVTFMTQDEKEIRYPQNGLIKGYSLGDKVTVLYESQNPQVACIDTFRAIWGGHVMFLLLGIIFIIIPIIKLLYPNTEWIQLNK